MLQSQNMPTALYSIAAGPEERTSAPKAPDKKLYPDPAEDRSQPLRRLMQCLFLALNLFIGFQFYLFVRHFESGGRWPALSRPPGVEGWLPIAGMMNLKYFLLTGTLPAIHPAAMFLLIAFLLICLLFRKAFCSWLCPVGSISEALWIIGRKFLKKNWILPRSADLPLRSIKYILLGLFLYAVASVPPPGIRTFMSAPYGLIADVKMLNFFRDLSMSGLVVLGLLILLSALVQNFWCRYLCPYGALLGLVALLSPTRIRRNPDLCISCGDCTQSCPSLLSVASLPSVRSAECTGCLACTSACPVPLALVVSLPHRRRLSGAALAAGIAIIFLGTVAYAKWAGAWKSPIPSSVYQDLVPRAQEFHHF
jgi:polyferredoxin